MVTNAKAKKTDDFFTPTSDDFAVWFYLILREISKEPGQQEIVIDTRQYKTLPKKLEMTFRHEGTKIIAKISETQKDRKKKHKKLILPKRNIIT